MTTRRGFLGGLARGAGALAAFRAGALGSVLAAGRAVAGRSAEEVAADEDYWRDIQQAFTVDRSLVNLNNGGVSPSPRIVQEAMRRYLELFGARERRVPPPVRGVPGGNGRRPQTERGRP